MYNLWRSKAKYQTANASFLRFSDGFWKLVLQNWWGYNYNLILKIDSKLYREQCLCEIFLAQLRSFKYIKHVAVILVLYLYMTVLFRFMSSCCCFDEPLFALNALSKDRDTDKLIILTNCFLWRFICARELHATVKFLFVPVSTAQGKGRLLISGLRNAISFNRTTRILCAF